MEVDARGRHVLSSERWGHCTESCNQEPQQIQGPLPLKQQQQCTTVSSIRMYNRKLNMNVQQECTTISSGSRVQIPPGDFFF